MSMERLRRRKKKDLDIWHDPDLVEETQQNSRRQVRHSIFEHREKARAKAEIDVADSNSVGRAMGGALEVEFDLYEEGMDRARTSQVKRELVLRKVDKLSRMNSDRIDWTFS